MFKKKIAVYTSFNADGAIAKGHLDALEIGPLKIKGEKGNNATLDLELTTTKQAVLIDGAIDFMGSHAGLYVDISKAGIEFTFNENFAGLLEYTVTGKSEGSISDPSTIDFSLTAEFSNTISAYLKVTVSAKIKEALTVSNTSVDLLQLDLTRKEAAFKAVFNPANAALLKAQADATYAIAAAQQAVLIEKQKWTALVQDAHNIINTSKQAYDTVFTNATRAVADTQLTFNAAMKRAQVAVDNAQKVHVQDVEAFITTIFNKAVEEAKNIAVVIPPTRVR